MGPEIAAAIGAISGVAGAGASVANAAQSGPSNVVKPDKGSAPPALTTQPLGQINAPQVGGLLPALGGGVDALSLARQSAGSAAAPAAPQSSGGFLGLDGNTWSGIASATGILASLMKPGQQAQVLAPGTQGPPGIQQQALGSGLGGSAAGLGRLSNFAIHSPLLGRGSSQTDLLSSLSS